MKRFIFAVALLLLAPLAFGQCGAARTARLAGTAMPVVGVAMPTQVLAMPAPVITTAAPVVAAPWVTAAPAITEAVPVVTGYSTYSSYTYSAPVVTSTFVAAPATAAVVGAMPVRRPLGLRWLGPKIVPVAIPVQ